MRGYWSGIKVGGLYRLVDGEVVTVLKVGKRPYGDGSRMFSYRYRKVVIMSGLRGFETIEFDNDFDPDDGMPLVPVV